MKVLDRIGLGRLDPADFAQAAARAGFQVSFITQSGLPLICLVSSSPRPGVKAAGLRLLGRVPQSVKGRPRAVDSSNGLINLRVWNVEAGFSKAAQKECQMLGIERKKQLSLTSAELKEAADREALGQAIAQRDELRKLNTGFDEKVDDEIAVDGVVAELDRKIDSSLAQVKTLQILRDQRAKVLREEREPRRSDFIDVAGGREI